MAASAPARGTLLNWAWSFYLLLAVAGILWLGLRHGEIGLGWFVGEKWLADLGLGLLTGGLMSGAWVVGRRSLREARRIEEYFAAVLGGLTGSEALALAVLSAIAEEFFFRGAVQDAWGFLAAAGLFTFLHVGPGREFRLWTLFAGIAGLVLGGLMMWRGTLLAPMIAHALVNAIGLSRLAALSPAAEE
ncbi:MAG: CPBP family intramembrane metalloprotease [Acidobacteriota bacterium]|nr:CPBP family intramembrane metalloprotease [Acidobacteriota bacterium]